MTKSLNCLVKLLYHVKLNVTKRLYKPETGYKQRVEIKLTNRININKMSCFSSRQINYKVFFNTYFIVLTAINMKKLIVACL